MNSVTRDWSRRNAASENKVRLSFREAQTLRAKLVSAHEIEKNTRENRRKGPAQCLAWDKQTGVLRRGRDCRLRLGLGEDVVGQFLEEALFL